LAAEVAGRDQQLGVVREEVKALNKQIAELKEKKDQLVRDLQSSVNTIKEREASLTRSRSANQALRKQIVDAAASASTLSSPSTSSSDQQELANMRTQAAQTAAIIGNLEDNIRSATDKLKASAETIQQLERDKKQLQSQADTHARESANHQRSMTQLQSQLNALQAQLDAETTANKAKIDALSAQAAEAKIKLDEAIAARKSAEKEKDTLANEYFKIHALAESKARQAKDAEKELKKERRATENAERARRDADRAKRTSEEQKDKAVTEEREESARAIAKVQKDLENRYTATLEAQKAACSTRLEGEYNKGYDVAVERLQPKLDKLAIQLREEEKNHSSTKEKLAKAQEKQAEFEQISASQFNLIEKLRRKQGGS